MNERAFHCDTGRRSGARPSAIGLLIVALNVWGCASEEARSSELIVDAAWLSDHLNAVQTIDVRALGDWRSARIPGATHVNVSDVRTEIDGVGGQVADALTVERVLRAAGVDSDAPLVVYGDETDTTAARMVWTLRYYGNADVVMLDGGWAAWQASGRSVETTTPSTPASDYSVEATVEALRVDAAWVLEHLDDPGVTLVDVRSIEEYGEGHIPGALNVDWHLNVNAPALRPRGEVAALYPTLSPDNTIVTYCRTGARGSVGFVVLSWLGFPDVRLYDGSWAEWGARPELPRELACAATETACAGECADVATHPMHCGACDAPCLTGQVCVAGGCVSACPAGEQECGGGCFDLRSSPAHCGACDNDCGPGRTCSLATCETGCADGLRDCGGTCRDVRFDPEHCGRCDRACLPGEVCLVGSCENM